MYRMFLVLFLLFIPAAVAYPQPGVIVPGDNLVAEGIPPIPASLAADVGRYTEFRSASLLSWHPTRRELLIGTRFADTTQVHHVASPGGARRQLTFFRDSVAGASLQPKHGDFFVFSKDAGGSEFFQKYRYDLASGAVSLLTDGKSRNSQGVWSTDGTRLAYHSTRRTGKDTDLYVMDPSDPKTDRLLTKLEGGGWSASDWSPDDRRLLLTEYVSINESYVWLIDASTGERTPLVARGAERAAHLGANFAKDGKSVFLITDRQGEFKQLTRFDLQGKPLGSLTAHIPWDVQSFDLSPDGKSIAFVTNEAGIGVLHLLDSATGEEMAFTQMPTESVGSVLWHPSGRDLGFTASSARSPNDVYSLGTPTSKIQRWTVSETGGLKTDHFAEPELVRWKSFDGLEITGFLYRPPAKFKGPRPVVINIHGGPESQFQPSFLGRNNYLINELGVAILFPNIRGSSGYGKKFLELDNGFLREDAYKDIASLFDWIKTREDLDAGRVMVTGGSYGGHMTLAIATRYADKIRCAVDVVGMSSLVTFLENTEGYRRDLRRAEYGDERDPKMRAFLAGIAPLKHADKITKPLFVIQGKNDPRVPASESEQMVATVRKQGTPVWYLMAKDEGHGFAKKQNADFQFYATVQFMKEYLLK